MPAAFSAPNFLKSELSNQLLFPIIYRTSVVAAFASVLIYFFAEWLAHMSWQRSRKLICLATWFLLDPISRIWALTALVYPLLEFELPEVIDSFVRSILLPSLGLTLVYGPLYGFYRLILPRIVTAQRFPISVSNTMRLLVIPVGVARAPIFLTILFMVTLFDVNVVGMTTGHKVNFFGPYIFNSVLLKHNNYPGALLLTGLGIPVIISFGIVCVAAKALYQTFVLPRLEPSPRESSHAADSIPPKLATLLNFFGWAVLLTVAAWPIYWLGKQWVYAHEPVTPVVPWKVVVTTAEFGFLVSTLALASAIAVFSLDLHRPAWTGVLVSSCFILAIMPEGIFGFAAAIGTKGGIPYSLWYAVLFALMFCPATAILLWKEWLQNRERMKLRLWENFVSANILVGIWYLLKEYWQRALGIWLFVWIFAVEGLFLNERTLGMEITQTTTSLYLLHAKKPYDLAACQVAALSVLLAILMAALIVWLMKAQHSRLSGTTGNLVMKPETR
jgi:hypothetical protein